MRTNKQKQFIAPAVTADVAIFTIEDGKLKVILVKRAIEPFGGRAALPGGFLFKEEPAEHAAKRVLKDKVGIADLKNVYLEQLYTFDSAHRDPRGHVLSVTYFALVEKNSLKMKKTDWQSAWYAVKDLPKLAFDHNKIIKYALKRLAYKLEYTSAVVSLMPRFFTLNQLQKTYEIIIGKKLDKRNFRKKFLALGLIKESGKKLSGVRQRPAELYQFKNNRIEELKRFF